MGFLETYTQQIHLLCKNHKVKSLYSFGSVNTEKFNPNSDIDFIVEFNINDPVEYSRHYFDLKFELAEMLNRPIDLLEMNATKNPYLIRSIEQSKVLVYG